MDEEDRKQEHFAMAGAQVALALGHPIRLSFDPPHLGAMIRIDALP